MNFDTIIIGAGLSGLKQANLLHKAGKENVLVTDFAAEIGGFLRAGITPGSLREKILTEAQKLPYTFWLSSTVTNVQLTNDIYTLTIHRKDGKTYVETKEVIVSTGALEKPRGANHIPGTRPVGEMTPYLALQILRRGYLPGLNPFIVINNDASKAVANQMKIYKDCQVITQNEKEIEVIEIKGQTHVEEVVIREKDSGETKTISCDSFVFSSGKIPNTSFLKNTNVKLDENKFVYTDKNGCTNLPGLYAKGECTVQKI